jgi:hypothetical protein
MSPADMCQPSTTSVTMQTALNLLNPPRGTDDEGVGETAPTALEERQRLLAHHVRLGHLARRAR